jgi:vacuolar-type H+-ATPase subunit F/Vma7
VFIGDEVEAAGFHLAGVRVRATTADDLLDVVQWARENAPLILVSAAAAERIPASVLDELLAGVAPAVVIVPDVHEATPMPDLAASLRENLGILE